MNTLATKQEIISLLTCLFEIVKGKYITRVDHHISGYAKGKRYGVDNKNYYLSLTVTSYPILREHIDRNMTLDKIKSFYDDIDVIDVLTNNVMRYLHIYDKLNDNIMQLSLDEFISDVYKFIARMLYSISVEEFLTIKKIYLYSYDYERYSFNIKTILAIRRKNNPRDPWLLQLGQIIFNSTNTEDSKKKITNYRARNTIHDTLSSIVTQDITNLRKISCNSSIDRYYKDTSMYILMGTLEILGKFCTYTLKNKKISIILTESDIDYHMDNNLLISTIRTKFSLNDKSLVILVLISQDKYNVIKFSIYTNNKLVMDNEKDLLKGYKILIKETYNIDIIEDEDTEKVREKKEEEIWDNEY